MTIRLGNERTCATFSFALKWGCLALGLDDANLGEVHAGAEWNLRQWVQALDTPAIRRADTEDAADRAAGRFQGEGGA